jgi:YVTN family beta-propeller protein
MPRAMTCLRARLASAAIGLAALAFPVAAGAAETAQPAPPGTRPVLFVANNWDGTADIVDPHTFAKLARINVIPDLQERLREIHTDPRRLGYFIGIRQLVGEGNDQYADDMFSSPDGRFVYVSRPSLADVVGIDLSTRRIVWRVPMEGYRSDHMAISPDGRRLLVSDSTARKVHVIDPQAGRKVAEFPSGDSPHENNYSKDGRLIFHASIGLVYTPADQPVADSTKGDRWFQVVDAQSYRVLRRLDIGKILEENGYPDYSSAVRPMALSPDEQTAYFQLSFLHGFVEFDLRTDKPLRIANLPISEEARDTPREDYLLDSAHHGLAMNPEGTKLCAAGTMSDYAAIVSRQTFAYKVFDVGRKPYWSTNSGDGRYCFVSVSGDDRVVVLDYATEREVARIPVGDHPQRMRMGLIRSTDLGGLPSSPGGPQRPGGPGARGPAKLRVLRAHVRRGKLDMRLQMTARATGKLGVTYIAGGRRTRSSLAVPRRARRGRSPLTWTVRRSVPRAQRRVSTGILQLSYAGNDRVRRDAVRSRAARGKARLRRTRTAIDDRGRLVARGRISRRARGVVRVRLGYEDAGDTAFLRYRARIRRGRWALREPLPSKAARDGGHLSIQFTGYIPRRIRGEQISKAVKP